MISVIKEVIEMSPKLMKQAKHGSSVPEGRVPKRMFGARIIVPKRKERKERKRLHNEKEREINKNLPLGVI